MSGARWMENREGLRPPLDDLAFPPVETPDGLALPLPLCPAGYAFISEASFWFELWMGGDFDVTVRLLCPVRLVLPGAAPRQLDARTARRSELAPLLQIKQYEVTEGLAGADGTLTIGFEGGGRLLAFSHEGFGWEVTWPLDDAPSWWVVGRDGRVYLKGDRPRSDVGVQPTATWSLPEPTQRGTESLPIHGQIAQCDVSFGTVEFEILSEDDDSSCVHFAGLFRLERKDGGAEIRADSEDRQEVGPALDLIGKVVAKAGVDRRMLHLEFSDGTRLETADDRWEAHWSAGSTESWFPEPGPRFP